MSVPDGSPPDLVFQYSVDPLTNTTLVVINGLQVEQTKYGNIFVNNNPLEPIGKYLAVGLIPNKNDAGVNGSLEHIGSLVFYLPEGSIQIAGNFPMVYNSAKDIYVPLNNRVLVNQITAGDGDFLNQTGYAVIITPPSGLNRNVLVYFNK